MAKLFDGNQRRSQTAATVTSHESTEFSGQLPVSDRELPDGADGARRGRAPDGAADRADVPVGVRRAGAGRPARLGGARRRAAGGWPSPPMATWCGRCSSRGATSGRWRCTGRSTTWRWRARGAAGLSASFILEEGLAMETLWRVVSSMAAAAEEAGVSIVTGRHQGGGPGQGRRDFHHHRGGGLDRARACDRGRPRCGPATR